MPDDPTKDHNKGLHVISSILEDAAQATEEIANWPPLPAAIPNGSWTVMVFMVADEVLRPFAERDFYELSRVGTRQQLNVFAGVHWGSAFKPQVVKVAQDAALDRPDESLLNSASNPPVARSVRETFKEFLDSVEYESRTLAHNHPLHRRLLVLWGHAYGMRFGGAGNEGMRIDEIAEVLQTRRDSLPIDILGFDACETSRLEVIHALGSVADHIIGSQIGVPYSGWPYDLILREIERSPGILPADLGHAILGHYYDSYRPPRVSLTMLNGETDYAAIRAEFNALVTGIAQVLSNDVAKAVFTTFSDSRHDSAEPVMDMLEFCTKLRDNLDQVNDPKFTNRWTSSNGTVGLRTAVQNLINSLSGGSVIQGHEERGPDVAHLNGLGLSAYDFTRRMEWDGYLDNYKTLNWPVPRPVQFI